MQKIDAPVHALFGIKRLSRSALPEGKMEQPTKYDASLPPLPLRGDARGVSPLSERECEVLRWAAAGKTSCEIGMILGVTERTVNFHVASAISKLNASNKTHAAVKALLLGIIVFD
jgi:DNA-binding CsgD family transcriptional regulator